MDPTGLREHRPGSCQGCWPGACEAGGAKLRARAEPCPMTVKEQACLVVVCDGCATRLHYEDCSCHEPSVPCHFESETAVAEGVDLEWWDVQDGRHLCRECAAPVCERRGHVWTTAEEMAVDWCRRCDAQRLPVGPS